MWTHYIDIPYHYGGKEVKGQKVERYNVVHALNQCLLYYIDRRFSGIPKDSEKLSFLMHFIGDIHCPMHCVTLYSDEFPEGDWIGLRFKVSGADCEKSTTLHGYWDHVPSIVIKRENISIQQYADRIMKKYPRSMFADELKETSFSEWADEIHEVALEVAYQGLGPGKNAVLSAEYQKRAEEYAMKLIALAGYRLGDTLNRLFN
jgi:hypothetical protein